MSERYVIVDLEGASRDYFDYLDDLAAWLQRATQKHPGVERELLVRTYDDAGKKIGKAQWAAECLARVRSDT